MGRVVPEWQWEVNGRGRWPDMTGCDGLGGSDGIVDLQRLVSNPTPLAGTDLANQLTMVCPMVQGHVYLLASKRNGTLYVGVTKDLPRRVYAHKIGKGSAFTRKYGVTMRVWSESYDLVVDAIQRETSIKRWPRRWKLALIEKDNPDWTDLAQRML